MDGCEPKRFACAVYVILDALDCCVCRYIEFDKVIRHRSTNELVLGKARKLNK